MRTPKEVLQSEINAMNKEYMRLLKLVTPMSSKEALRENAEDRAEINARINEFNNAISKLL